MFAPDLKAAVIAVCYWFAADCWSHCSETYKLELDINLVIDCARHLYCLGGC